MKRIAAAGLIILGTCAAAMADAPLTIYSQVWSPAHPDDQTLVLLMNDQTRLEGEVETAWQQNSGLICDKLKQMIESPLEYNGDEFRGYDTVCNMSPGGDFTVGQGGYGGDGSPNIPFTFKTSAYLEFTVTQPLFDKWADPRLSVAFDLTINYMISVALGTPDGGQPMPAINLVNASATVSNLKVDTHGPIADEVMAVVDLYKGPLFVKGALAAVDGTRVNVPVAAADLSGLNLALAASLGGRRITGAFGIPADNQLILVVTDAWKATPGNNTAAVVSWKTGEPGVNDCGIFNFVAETQTGPAPIVSWASKEMGPAPTYRFPATDYTLPSAWADGKTRCQAVIHDIPTGAPETVMPTAGVNGSVGQFAGVVSRLTPQFVKTASKNYTQADFVLTSQVKPGTGVSVVKTKPKVNKGDPAPIATKQATPPVDNTTPLVDIGKILGAFAGQNQAPVQTQNQGQTSAKIGNTFKNRLKFGTTNIQPTTNLNPTLH